MATKKERLDFSDEGSVNSLNVENSVQGLANKIPFKDIERSQTFFDLLDSFILLIDENSHIILANKKARNFLGFEDKEVANINFPEICIPEDEKENVLSFFSSILSDGKVESQVLETSIIGLDGTSKSFSINTSLLKDTFSSEKAFLLSCAAISKQKEPESHSLPAVANIFTHLDSIPYSLILSDYRGMITFWNRNASILFGYEKSEVLGKPISLIMPKRYRKAHEGWDELISIGKSPVVGKIIEVTGLRKNGTEFPIELAITTTRVKGEIFHGAFINDISKRKMKERLMTISKNKYRMIFEKSPLGIFHFDERGVITQCNENFVKIVGAPEETVISAIMGFNMLESFKDESIKKAIQQVLAGIPARYEDNFDSPFSNKVIPIKAEFSPVISEEGKLMGGVCVVEDFTERKAAEEALNKYAEELARANEELKSLDRMKDEFLSNLRHELTTPLIPIKGYSELMFDGALGELSEKQHDAMEKIMLSSERLKRLIDSLLYVSITEGGSVDYTFLPLRMSEVIDSAIRDRSPEIASKRHEIERSIPSDIPLIEGDLEYLQEVFVNVIDNSVKFTQEDGKIEVSVVLQEDKKLHIKVSDNGIGISEENLPLIFNRFYQVDGSSTRKYGGNGLGLYICKKIIVAHNGQMWAESKEGVGTDIHILLPVK
ncbi:PAS domain-containing sensor histidine kinase [Methanolobus sp. ZRKC4]|uniref:PAS domain S-box protein n=1 Tax=Methanolobus sp. ZRKC4 TaxID=3125787 RepID=UPI00325413F1